MSRQSPMRFGILAFAERPFDELATRVRFFDELGFDSAWVNDDALTPGIGALEPWTVLGALAMRTKRVRLGTLVSTIVYRHPVFLAAQAFTLDQVSRGRAALALGAGGPPNPYAMFGHGIWSPRERVERLKEQATIIAPLLRGERVTFEGKHYVTRDAQIPELVGRPKIPFTIAAHGDRSLRIVAEYADGWNTMTGQPAGPLESNGLLSLAEQVAETARLSDRLDEIARDIGRDPLTIRRTVTAFRPKIDPFSSLDAFDEYVGRYGEIGLDEIIFYWPPLAHPESEAAATAPHPEPQPVTPATRAMFERIAAERIANR